MFVYVWYSTVFTC